MSTTTTKQSGFIDISQNEEFKKLIGKKSPISEIDISSLLPTHIYFDTSNEEKLLQIDNVIPGIIGRDVLISDAFNSITVAEQAKIGFTVFSGFPEAQKLFRKRQAIFDLKSNPEITYDDIIQLNSYELKLRNMLDPLAEQIGTLKTADGQHITNETDITD